MRTEQKSEFTKNGTVFIAGISKDTFINEPMSSNILKYVSSPENDTEQFEKESGFSGTVRLFFPWETRTTCKAVLVQFQHWF